MDDVKEHEIVRATQLRIGSAQATGFAGLFLAGLVYNTIVFSAGDLIPYWVEMFILLTQLACVLVMFFFVGSWRERVERGRTQYPMAHALSHNFFKELSLKEKFRLYYKTLLGKTYGL